MASEPAPLSQVARAFHVQLDTGWLPRPVLASAQRTVVSSSKPAGRALAPHSSHLLCSDSSATAARSRVVDSTCRRHGQECGPLVAGHDDHHVLQPPIPGRSGLAVRRALLPIASTSRPVVVGVVARLSGGEAARELPVGAGQGEQRQRDEPQHRGQPAEEVRHRRLPRRVPRRQRCRRARARRRRRGAAARGHGLLAACRPHGSFVALVHASDTRRGVSVACVSVVSERREIAGERVSA
jgi:hypothetical protein